MEVQELPELAPASDAPSLDDFAYDNGLEDFSHAEQLRAYQEAYGGPTKRQLARVRLLDKQLRALHWLATLSCETPVADDPPGAWLIPMLAAPIEAAGIKTLRQLAERINGMGAGWHTAIPAIGAGKAARVVNWLRAASADTRLVIGEHAATRRGQMTAALRAAAVAPATGVVAIDKFVVPATLSGAAGRFRAPSAHCTLGVDTDLAALLAYIRGKPTDPAHAAAMQARWRRAHPHEALPDGPFDWLRWVSPTAASYFDEVYRFMLWAIVQREKALSSIDHADAAAYRDFLRDPQPADRWCSGARGREKWGPAWRPFAGPLGATAAARTLKILSAFYAFLLAQGYLVANPFAGLARPRAAPDATPVGRSLTVAHWATINAALDALPPTTANARLRFGLRLMYATGVRRAEVLAAKVRDLRWVSYPPDDDDPEPAIGWELDVLGKGGKPRTVPVPGALVDDLVAYLGKRGLMPDLADPVVKEAHLLGQAMTTGGRGRRAHATGDPLAGIGAQTWHDQLKGFFQECAEQLEERDAAGAAQLARASAHWLRHTKVSHSLAAGTDTDIERLAAGHASIGTTSQYAHAEGKRRLRGSERFFESWGVARRTP